MTTGQFRKVLGRLGITTSLEIHLGLIILTQVHGASDGVLYVNEGPHTTPIRNAREFKAWLRTMHPIARVSLYLGREYPHVSNIRVVDGKAVMEFI